MNNVQLDGVVTYKNDKGDFILYVGDEFIHCRGKVDDLEIGDPKIVEGCLRSSVVTVRGLKMTMFFVEET